MCLYSNERSAGLNDATLVERDYVRDKQAVKFGEQVQLTRHLIDLCSSHDQSQAVANAGAPAVIISTRVSARKVKISAIMRRAFKPPMMKVPEKFPEKFAVERSPSSVEIVKDPLEETLQTPAAVGWADTGMSIISDSQNLKLNNATPTYRKVINKQADTSRKPVNPHVVPVERSRWSDLAQSQVQNTETVLQPETPQEYNQSSPYLETLLGGSPLRHNDISPGQSPTPLIESLEILQDTVDIALENIPPAVEKNALMARLSSRLAKRPAVQEVHRSVGSHEITQSRQTEYQPPRQIAEGPDAQEVYMSISSNEVVHSRQTAFQPLRQVQKRPKLLTQKYQDFTTLC